MTEMKNLRKVRRQDALSRERVVDAAIELLDQSGEEGLTFRTLAASLGTGAGAIYWHVANKDELLAHATNDVLTKTLDADPEDGSPGDTIRSVVLSLFDAIDEHPWIAPQLSRDAWQSPATMRIFEVIGRQLQRAGVPLDLQFNSATALMTFTLGAATENAANARRQLGAVTRTEYLSDIGSRWEQLDPTEFPFTHQVISSMRDHDDRTQFLTGINVFLVGLGIVD